MPNDLTFKKEVRETGVKLEVDGFGDGGVVD